MPVHEEEINAAVKALRARLELLARSVTNLQAPKYIAPAIEQLVRVALHDAEQVVRKALNPTHEVEPWAKPTPEELALKQAAMPPVEDEDGLDEIRQELQGR